MFSKISKLIQCTTMNGRSHHSCIHNYEDAVRALNKLQSNANYIFKVTKHNLLCNDNLQETEKFMFRTGLTHEDLNRLSIIHVAGTKGKGSTCSFVEAILREHGFKTGFFSSPHLVSLCERFRINGKTINKENFTQHFWQVYNKLNENKENESDMPQYFKFLTILMFHIFLNAKIDVAIVEVGIGGELDCTNIIKNPVCTGITSLGLDHTNLLGNTLEKIAFQKSGIFKNNCPAFTVPQLNEAMTVLQKRAIEKNCTLTIVPNIESYDWKNDETPILGIQSKVQNVNASLAIQLSSCWMKRAAKVEKIKELDNNLSKEKNKLNKLENKLNNILINDSNNIFKKAQLNSYNLCMNKVAKALESCKWPGRTQILYGKSMDFYIDGAHTLESIESCIIWFKEKVKNTPEKKYLIFNITGDRDSVAFFSLLKSLKFHKVIFSTNNSGIIGNVDQENTNAPIKRQMTKCQELCKIWGEGSLCVNNVNEALEFIKNDKIVNSKPKVLVTGSLHLVGALLAIVDPELKMKTDY